MWGVSNWGVFFTSLFSLSIFIVIAWFNQVVLKHASRITQVLFV
jgi:hypothetical protein